MTPLLWGGAAGCVVLAAAMRAPWLGLPAVGEELAMVTCRLADIVPAPESGVNPPLYRWLVNLGPDAAVVDVGRRLSLVGGALAAGLAVPVSRGLGARALPALAAGGLLAVAPEAVEQGAVARAYGLAQTVLALYLLALAAWRARPHALSRGVTAGAMAALAVHLHYLLGVGVVALALLGPAIDGRREVRRAWLAAGTVFTGLVAPLAWRVLTGPHQRAAAGGGARELGETLLSLGLAPTGFWRGWAHTAPGAGVAWVVVALLLVGLWRGGLARRAALGTLVWTAGLVAVGGFALVRPAVAVLVAVVAAPAAASVLQGPARLAAPVLAFAATIGLDAEVARRIHRPSEAVRDVVVEALSRGRLAAGPVHVAPRGAARDLAFLLGGVHPNCLPSAARCALGESCFVVGDHTLIGVDALAAGPGSWLRLDAPPDPAPAGCAPIAAEGWVIGWRCGEAQASGN